MHEGVHVQLGGEPPQVSAGEAHAVPGAHVPPHPSLGRSPHGRVEGGAHVGAQQPAAPQRSPAAQRVPFGHAAHPGGSIGSTPHARELAAAHPGQHEPAVHALPAAHIVPSPQVRHTAPDESRWSGMSTPHATLEAVGQRGQQPPAKQSDPAGHMVPAPQSRHTAPPEVTSGTGMPHATVELDAQAPQQTRASAPLVPGGFTHDVPLAQRVPKPLHIRQLGDGIGSPQSTADEVAQAAQHMPLAPPVQVEPAAHPAVP